MQHVSCLANPLAGERAAGCRVMWQAGCCSLNLAGACMTLKGCMGRREPLLLGEVGLGWP